MYVLLILLLNKMNVSIIIIIIIIIINGRETPGFIIWPAAVVQRSLFTNFLGTFLPIKLK